MQIQPLRGTRSLYPNEMRQRTALMNACKGVLERAGYEEYEAPILEPMALYEAKSSAEIVERQSYTFVDRGGEKIVVRPELTPSLARMVANKQRELPPLLRWFSLPDCWRYERPQKGRTRNFLQLNVDFLGSDSVEADVETIDLALSMLQAAGMDMAKVEMRVNDRRALDEACANLGVAPEQKNAFLSLLDERDKLSAEEFLTQLQTLNPQLTLDRLGAIDNIERTERLIAIMDAVTKLGWTQLIYEPSLVRGFSYYTGVVFEVFETSGEFRRAIFGGGRYDNLLEAVGGQPMSAVGFAVSDVALLTALDTQGRNASAAPSARTLVIPFSENEVDVARDIAKRLRTSGTTALTAVPPYVFKKQLQLANRLGVTEVVIVAPEELAAGNIIVKNMTTGEQVVRAIDGL